MPQVKSPTTEIIEEIIRVVNGDRWVETAETVAKVDKTGVFDTPAFKALAVKLAKRQLVRMALRRKGEDGMPLFPNIKLEDMRTGRKRRVYMREQYMRPTQYRQVVDYYRDYAGHGMDMANAYTDRCNTRYRTDWKLPFPDQKTDGADAT